ncbi:hypothetical protein NIASO_12070 [Niabella soli DSM 19437]|uniref:DUF2784 domain-containing protein n=2 Tax=Niabella TaxID=379899 RepID=W0F2J2_9BACT|nr:hypothetical protein NIASO_12070 [Niabella soli DSM 19437]
MYLFLTQLTVVFHLLFILFVIIGGFFAHKNRWVAIVHFGALAWAIYAELSPGVVCPLTTLENYFGQHAGLSTYKEDFITRHLIPVIYQENVTYSFQVFLVVLVICINVIAYRIRWNQKDRNS